MKLGVDAVAFDFPKGFAKAYQNKVAICFCAEFLLGTTVPALQMVSVCCWSLAEFSYVIDNAGMFLTDAQAQRAVQLANLYLECHTLMARKSLLAGVPRWKIRPRTHSFGCEIVAKMSNGSRLNPKHLSCWSDESYIGKTCQIGLSKAVHTSTLHKRLLQRLLMQMNAGLAETVARE